MKNKMSGALLGEQSGKWFGASSSWVADESLMLSKLQC